MVASNVSPYAHLTSTHITPRWQAGTSAKAGTSVSVIDKKIMASDTAQTCGNGGR